MKGDKAIIARLFICLVVLGLCLYSYIDKQNQVTELRICIPQTIKETKKFKEENTRLQYEIDQFENPQHLMELARQGTFSHLKHPLFKQVMTMNEGIALQLPTDEHAEILPVKPKVSLAVGAKAP